MRRHMNTGLWGLVVASVLWPIGLAPVVADDLKQLDVPVFRDRVGYGLAVTEYGMNTQAELLEGDAAEHSISLSGLLQPPERADVLCFATALLADSAEDDRGKDLLLPQRRRKDAQYRALLPSSAYQTRRGDPLLLSEVTMESASLKRPGYEVQELVVIASAVVVEERESEEIDAEVVDRYIDIGNDTEVKVSAKEVDKGGEMTVKLNVKRTGNKTSPVIDSVYALNKKGKAIGGGRWTNELDLFAKGYEVELIFPLSGDEDSVEKLRIVLATEYEIEEVKLTVDGLFKN